MATQCVTDWKVSLFSLPGKNELREALLQK